MTPLSPRLPPAAFGLLAGIGCALLAAGTVPDLYHDAIELRLFDMPIGQSEGRAVTPAWLVAEVAMAVVIFLFGKEAWEALRLERGPVGGARALWPALMAAGAIAGGAIVWLALALPLGAGETARWGWLSVAGAEAVLAGLFARLAFRPGSAAMQMLILVALLQTLAALGVTAVAVATAGAWQPAWLALPLCAALAGRLAVTGPAEVPGATERQRTRAQSLAPWLALGFVSWAGTVLAGLPGALGLLPVLPAMPHARRSFGLFAEVEAVLGDMLNRTGQMALAALPLLLFALGFTQGGAELAAAGAETLLVVAALLAGKTAGCLAIWALSRRLHAETAPSLSLSEALTLALFAAPAFTAPVLALEHVLPGGAAAEAARLGLVLSLSLLPALALAARHRDA